MVPCESHCCVLVCRCLVTYTHNSYQDPDPASLDCSPPKGNKWVIFSVCPWLALIYCLYIGNACSLMPATWMCSCVTHMPICGPCGVLPFIFTHVSIDSDIHWPDHSMSLHTAVSAPVRSSRVLRDQTSWSTLCECSLYCLCLLCWFIVQSSQESAHLWFQRWLAGQWCSSLSHQLLLILHGCTARPVICFLDQPIIHVTFGLVEYSNLITVSASGRKSISLTVMDTEFDLAWAYYCTVFGGQNMELYVPQNNPYIVFSTYPSNNSEFLCVFTHFVYST